jgi:hypothetical protein
MSDGMRLKELSIMPAPHGGFVVWSRNGYNIMNDRFDGRELLFAGSLADAVEFLRADLSSPSDPPGA